MFSHKSVERDECRMDSFDIMMVTLRFNEKINQRDLEGLVELMTDDHTFIDNSGDVDKNMREGFANAIFPELPTTLATVAMYSS
jgi:ketosteroid isomerase-like protein